MHMQTHTPPLTSFALIEQRQRAELAEAELRELRSKLDTARSVGKFILSCAGVAVVVVVLCYMVMAITSAVSSIPQWLLCAVVATFVSLVLPDLGVQGEDGGMSTKGLVGGRP